MVSCSEGPADHLGTSSLLGIYLGTFPDQHADPADFVWGTCCESYMQVASTTPWFPVIDL